jgi:hypothetical protein
MDNDFTLKAAALTVGFVTENEFDRVDDSAKMITAYCGTPGLMGDRTSQRSQLMNSENER